MTGVLPVVEIDHLLKLVWLLELRRAMNIFFRNQFAAIDAVARRLR